MFSRILVPTDGSEPSQRAAALAAKLALQWGSEVILITVVKVPQSLVLVAGMGDIIGDYDRAAGEEALRPARTILSEAGLVAREEILEGSAGKMIVEAVRTSEATIVVMGSRGHGEVLGLFLGSTSDHVAHSLEVPLVLVP